jgi:quinol monooxygenase YgiN
MTNYLFARLHALPGRRDEVQLAMSEIHGPTRQQPGCLEYGAFRSLRDPDEFTIHSVWADLAAFERRAASVPAHAALRPFASSLSCEFARRGCAVKNPGVSSARSAVRTQTRPAAHCRI